MNPDARSLPALLRTLTCRNFFSVLAGAFLFISGLPANSIAAPGRGDLAAAPPPYQVSISITKNNALADNIQQDLVLVHVMEYNAADGLYDIVGSNVDVTFSANGVNPVLETDASGNATLSLSNTVAGNLAVDVLIGGVPYGSTSVTFISTPGPPNLAACIIQVVISPALANGVSVDQVQVHLVDIYGNPIGNQNVVLTILSGTANFAPGGAGPVTVTTASDGIALVSLHSTVAGNVVVQASYLGNIIGNGSGGNSVTVQFIAGAPSVSNPATQLTVVVTGSPADGSTPNTINAHIVDANGNPVPGATVVFTITGGTAAGNANMVGGATVTTNSNGDATLNITDITAGTVTFTATVNGVPITNGSPVTVTFVASTPSVSNPATQLTVVVTGSPADGSTPNTINAHIVDANGNVVSGATVVFTITGGTAAANAVLAGGATVTTNSNGDATLNITDITAGTVIFTATVNGVSITNGSPATVTFVASAPSVSNPATQLTVVVTGSPADGSTPNTINAHIVDANGNVVPGATVVFTITGGTAAANAVMAGGATVTTNSNGDATLNITDITAGTVTFTATVNGVPITNGSPVTVTFVASTPSSSNPSTQLIVVVTGSPADGATPNTINAHIVDANGNVVTGATVVFTITGGTAAANAVLAGGATVTTNGNGDATLNLTDVTAGTVIFTATVNGVAITNGSPATVTFVASAPSASGGKTDLVIITNNVVADGVTTDSLNAIITDINGNPVQGVTVTFDIEAGGTSTGTAQFVESVTATTDANGIATIGLTNTVAGTVNVGASISVGGIPTPITNSPQMVTFTNAPDVTNPQTQLIVVVYEAIANGMGSTVVKAHIVDQNGDPIADQTVVFAIDSGSAQIITPGPWTTDANGDVSISLTSKTPGFVLITATVGGKSITFGSPARVQFAAINIYVPRVFTPNGDGTNDVLKPILVGIANFHYFNVYNRWGNLIFTTQDPNQGWNGMWKGAAQPVESYLWIAEGIDVNGNKIVQKGVVSLVR